MLKALTAHTFEIDDTELAVSEILDKLGIEENLSANSVGIITCYSEFIDSGVVSELCDKLPFPVIGTTTLGAAVGGAYGQLMLGILVLTGDDVSFSATITDPIDEDFSGPIERSYEQALGLLAGEPKLIIALAPLIFHYAGDQYVEILGTLSGGAPVFGTISVDHTSDYSECQVFMGDNFRNDSLAILLVSGNIDPKFYVTTVSESKILKQTAVITGAEGNILKEVNEMPLASYLETRGLATGGQISPGVNAIPFFIDYGDGGAPVSRALFAITPDGHGVCGGIMPVGANISVGAMDRQDILDTTNSTLLRALAEGKPNALIMFSCVGRNIALGVDTLAELSSAEDTLKNATPFLLAYSGGEICPDATGCETINRFHNNTFVALAL